LVHGAAATISVGPDLLHRRDQTRCTVRDHEPRTAQATPGEIATEVDPVLARLALTEADRQQHPFAAELIAPRHQHTLLAAAGARRQIHRIQKERNQLDLSQALGAECDVLGAQSAHTRLAAFFDMWP